jgi:hypothetical protein
MTPAPKLSATQHALIAAALRQAAALELAMGNPQTAGLRLVAFIAEEKQALPQGRVNA